MKFSDFEKIFEQSQNELIESVKAFSWKSAQAYSEWLANTHHYVVNSTRILALAAAHMPPHLSFLSNRFIAHAAEETGHEKLLERDLKTLGFNIGDLSVTHEMRFYHASLYFWMSPQGNPVGLLGWILSLEGLATHLGPWAYKICKETHSDRASNFLRVHAEEDPDHLEKALKAIKPLNENDVRCIAETLEMYSSQYTAILRAIEKNTLSRQVA